MAQPIYGLLVLAGRIETDLDIVLLEGAERTAASLFRLDQIQSYSTALECAAVIVAVNITDGQRTLGFTGGT
jgi:hypothetical protein